MSFTPPIISGGNDRPEMEKLVSLYIKTKALILRAEEMDSRVSSSVPIIKEQRDAFDHLMRYIGDHFAESPKGPKYRTDHLDKAIGHIFRAAFDALDSLNISLKLRISDAMEGHSNEAISTVFPQYYNEHCALLHEINERVVASRNAKDIGSIAMEKLEDYVTFMEKLLKISLACQQAAPGLVEYDRRQKKSKVWAVVGGIGLVVLGWLLSYIFPSD